jgi:hypothetical protein
MSEGECVSTSGCVHVTIEIILRGKQMIKTSPLSVGPFQRFFWEGLYIVSNVLFFTNVSLYLAYSLGSLGIQGKLENEELVKQI